LVPSLNIKFMNLWKNP